MDYEGDQRTTGYILQDVAGRNPDRVCVYCGDQKVTYRELYEKSNQVSNGLLGMGLKKGDRVAVMLPNCVDYVVAQFGITKVGMIEANINTEARGAVLAHYLNNSDPAALIVDEQFLPLVKSVENSLVKAPRLIIRSEARKVPDASLDKKFGMVAYSELFRGSKEAPRANVSNTDVSGIFYTSGTTGVSKGVVMCHNHQWHFARNIVLCGRMTPDDIMYSVFPYYHGIPQYMCTLPAFLAEGAVAVAERFSATRFWQEVRRYKATIAWSLYSVPSVLMKQPERPDDSDNTMRVIFTGGLDPQIWDAFEKRFGVKVLNIYGSTEQNMLTATPYDEKRIGSAGKALDDFDVAIADENDNILPPGEIGEIVSRPKMPYIQMMEYYDMPRETLKAFRNLWLHSGDLAYVDKDGWLFFSGRAKDTIRRRGENISALEVENVINSHEAVKECAVVPVPAELGEEEIKVCIVLQSGKALAPSQLIAFCEGKMAKYMVPRYVQFRQSLPKTPTDRVEKAKLKEEGVTPDTWDATKQG